ncbi:hypothetical protein [Geothermobacter hydrogeniphilus]|uniref:hypothetical protein n=1 Tax=Geothermobacter hydrogeniphilus TaxID=1969733 RepID=UPI001FEC33CA|nr:hypothetical protein [Geothermobacter hydrogeniphilus]
MSRLLQDHFDRWHVLVLLLAVFGAAALLLTAGGGGDAAARSELNRQLEQDVAYRARIDFLQDLYRPVLDLEKSGARQQALLKLEEISRRYPGEGYGFIIKGRILLQLDAVEEAVANYVDGVRLNGDFADRQGPFSAWNEINQLVSRQLPSFSERARTHPDNATLKRVLSNLHYLQSRLAGGCE